MFGIEKDYQKLLEQIYGPLGEKPQMTEKELIEIQIAHLQGQIKEKQKKLKELEQTKSSVEEAYKDAYGKYPVKEVSENLTSEDNWNVISWSAFQKGYERAQQKEVKPSITNCVITGNPPDGYVSWSDWFIELGSKGILHNLRISSKNYEPTPQTSEQVNTFAPKELEELMEKGMKQKYDHPYKIADEHGETNPYKQYLNSVEDEKKMEELGFVKGNWMARPLDWVKPQTPEQVADGLKEAFREAINQGVIPPVEIKQKTLTNLIERWWCDGFTTHSDWDMETSIDDLVDRIQLWLPKEQFANSQNEYVELTVEGFNDCLNKIKDNLR